MSGADHRDNHREEEGGAQPTVTRWFSLRATASSRASVTPGTPSAGYRVGYCPATARRRYRKQAGKVIQPDVLRVGHAGINRLSYTERPSGNQVNSSKNSRKATGSAREARSFSWLRTSRQPFIEALIVGSYDYRGMTGNDGLMKQRGKRRASGPPGGGDHHKSAFSTAR